MRNYEHEIGKWWISTWTKVSSLFQSRNTGCIDFFKLGSLKCNNLVEYHWLPFSLSHRGIASYQCNRVTLMCLKINRQPKILHITEKNFFNRNLISHYRQLQLTFIHFRNAIPNWKINSTRSELIQFLCHQKWSKLKNIGQANASTYRLNRKKIIPILIFKINKLVCRIEWHFLCII